MPRRARTKGSSSDWLSSARSRCEPYTGQETWSGLSSDVFRRVLPSGVRVLIKEVYPTSVVSVAFWIGVGALHETDEEAGVSHFVEHMLFKGSQARPPGALTREIHALGGYVNAFTSFESTCLWCVVPGSHLPAALEALSETVLNPLFEPAQTEREIGVILDEMHMRQDRPETWCTENLLRLAFPRHPYGRPVIGLEPVLRAMDPSRLRGHHQAHYVAQNMAVVVVGDVQAEPTCRRIQDLLGALAPGPVLAQPPRPDLPQEGLRRLDLEQDFSSAHLQMLFPLPSLFSPGALACDLVSSVLGDGRSSRLFRRLRERQGLVARVGCTAFLEREAGFLILDCTLPPENLEKVEAGVFEELEVLGREGPTRWEMQKARNRAESAFVFNQETVEGIGRTLGHFEMLGDHTLADLYVRRLAGVRAEEVLEACRLYLQPERCSVVRCGPPRVGAGS